MLVRSWIQNRKIQEEVQYAQGVITWQTMLALQRNVALYKNQRRQVQRNIVRNKQHAQIKLQERTAEAL